MPQDPSRTPETELSERQQRWKASALGREDFLAAPLEQERPEASRPLRLVAAYFEFTGTVNLLVLGISFLASSRLDDPELREALRNPVLLLIALGMSAAMIYTGHELRKRSRSAAIGAAVAFALPAVSSILNGAVSLGALLGLLGLGFLKYVWKELE